MLKIICTFAVSISEKSTIIGLLVCICALLSVRKLIMDQFPDKAAKTNDNQQKRFTTTKS